MNLNWKYPENKSVSQDITSLVGSKIVAQILANRGIDTINKAKAFISPLEVELCDSEVFVDMKKAVERAANAIENKESVVIYGDFDCDGVTSTSVLYKTFRHLGADISYYIPDRTDEGHGLNSAALCKIISSKKAKLIITTDNGISNVQEIKLAKGLGADIIITDHHEAPEILPEALAIINPKAPGALSEDLSIDEIQSLQNLAGVGVAYKFAMALLDHYDKKNFSDEILYLVAIGTVADVVPLVGENRTLVQRGLNLISEKKPIGILKLIQSAGGNLENVTADTVAFAVAPRINAAGRLDHASKAVELFVEEDSKKLDIIAKQLCQYNQNRQEICDSTYMESEYKIEELDLKKNKAIIIHEKNWHPGIIGIVASKLVEKYYRPVFMIKYDEEANEARCSARSIEALHLYEILDEISDVFKVYGGHSMAAGFVLDLNKIKFNDFIKLLNDTVNKRLDEKDMLPSLNIDANIDSDELNFDFMEKINQLAPFGAANTPPIFSISDLSLKQIRVIGSSGKHLKMSFLDKNSNMLDAVWWNKEAPEVEIMQKLKIAFSPQINTFNGKSSIQLDTKDLKLISGANINIQPRQASNTKAVSSDAQEISHLAENKVIWHDHRKKNNIFKAVNNYLKSETDQISVFAENKEIIGVLEKYSELGSRLVSRIDIKNSDQLMFFDFPADLTVFKTLYSQASPKKVHVMKYNLENINTVDFIKQVSGMLKYAHANRDGQIKINLLASKLSTSDSAIKSCIELLERAKVISVVDMNDEICVFDFLKVCELSSIKGTKEYCDLEREIQNIQKFRQELSQGEISELKNLV